ncbi:unnamed protein product [Diabrotica balteata]|uniref:THAP-type domain-containing protein n=1 Tax=Diabrotica balteata TaxID=107213 RepID=A0A9N9SNL9_DIABA|nr:unnamed protein product [Diabrotica balteata]
MPRHCSVPNCKSNYATTLKYEKAQSTFSFPKNDHLRTQWVRSINREDFRVTSSSVVCKKHFDATDIIESESFIDKNGTVLQRNLVYPKLKENAIPRIFENQPSYLSNPKPPTRKNPETRRAEISLREENNIKELENKDLIVDFKELLQSVSERVELKNWQIKVVEERICFYLLNIDNQFSDECIKVISNINITKELLVSVYVKDIQLSPHDLKCILPFDCKLSRWSQLENLLSRFVHSRTYVTLKWFVSEGPTVCVRRNFFIFKCRFFAKAVSANPYTMIFFIVFGLICPIDAPPMNSTLQKTCSDIQLSNELYTLTNADGTIVYGGVVEQYTIDGNTFLIINDHATPSYFISLKNVKENDVYATYLEGITATKVDKEIISKNNLIALEQEHLKSLSFGERQAIFHEFFTAYHNYSNLCTTNYSILQKLYKVNLVQLVNFLNNTMKQAEASEITGTPSTMIHLKDDHILNLRMEIINKLQNMDLNLTQILNFLNTTKETNESMIKCFPIKDDHFLNVLTNINTRLQKLEKVNLSQTKTTDESVCSKDDHLWSGIFIGMLLLSWLIIIRLICCIPCFKEILPCLFRIPSGYQISTQSDQGN